MKHKCMPCGYIQVVFRDVVFREYLTIFAEEMSHVKWSVTESKLMSLMHHDTRVGVIRNIVRASPAYIILVGFL